MEAVKRKTAELVDSLNPNFDTGLSDAQVDERIRVYGRNVLFPKKRSLHSGIKAFLTEPMVWLLGIAAIVYYLLGETLDAAIMALAIIPIGLIDAFVEMQTDRALERLEKMSEPKITVMRNGRKAIIGPEELVPGDRMHIEEGELVMADAAIVEASDLKVDESSLTGESVPVDKRHEPRFSDDFFRNSGTVFAGTRVLSGMATCLVVKTGQATSYGRIGGMLARTESRRTRLQQDIDRIVRAFGVAAVALSVFLVLLSMYFGEPWTDAVINGVSLAIAAIPEEFPVVFILFLSMGMLGLAKANALIKKLSAVEALGSVNVICTDKTGTLTSGRMALTGIYTDRAYRLEDFRGGDFMLHAMMACEKEPFDYMEKAIFEAAGPDAKALAGWKLFHEYEFNPVHKYMSHVWKGPGGKLVICAKGSVEGIIARCRMGGAERARILKANEELGGKGIRVLALASRPLARCASREADEKDMEFSGLMGFYDPLREGIADSVREAKGAGVRVMMLTGDHKSTALFIARQAGMEQGEAVEGGELERMDGQEFVQAIKSHSIFCRMLPEQKLRIVETLQKLGYSVAVTGDGINDAPALKKADVGISMGLRGNDVSREAADLVLLDDNFRTIVNAIRNGRRVYDNLQKSFSYLISFHVPIFLSALIVPVMRLPLLLMPIHIVFLELVLHPVVSIVFEGQPAEPDIMARKPRDRDSPIIRREQMARLLGLGALIFLLSLAAYVWALRSGYDEFDARTLGFTTLMLGQVITIATELNKRRITLSALARNTNYIGIVAAVVVSYLVIMYVPFLSGIFRLEPLTGYEWGIAIALGLIPLAFAELTKR